MAAMLLSTLLATATAVKAPSRARVGYTEGVALGVDTAVVFGWSLDDSAATRGETQAAYQLVVTRQGQAMPFYDSGKVASNSTQQVTLPVGLGPLPHDASFDWCVRWWPSSDLAAPPSPWLHSSFSTGLGTAISAGDGQVAGWAGAQWIVPSKVPHHGQGNQLRKAFTLPAKVERAALYVACLGYFQAEINGQRTSDKLLGDFTNFEKRTWYETFNVTQQLRAAGGDGHAIGLMLAPGWTSRHGTGKEGTEVLVRLSIDLAGGAGHVDIVSDESWQGGDGPLVKADVYLGETYNASRSTPGWSNFSWDPEQHGEGTGASPWVNATLGKPPANMSNPKLNISSTVIASHASLPPIRVTGTQAPIDWWKVPGKDAEWVFDFGVNRAGVTRLHIPAAVAAQLGSGATWVQQASEGLSCAKPCSIGHYPTRGNGAYAAEVSTYISDIAHNSVGSSGDGAAAIDWTPQFAQYGFRYVAVHYSHPSGVAWAGPDNSTLTMQYINTAAPMIASVVSSGGVNSAMLNQIQAMHVSSAASNWMSIPTDCPQRAERLGWMGDAYTSGETQLHNYDLAGAYAAFLQQIEDNQPHPGTEHAGAVPDCVPFYGGHCHIPSSPSWGTAYPTLANWVFEYYDDVALVHRHYRGVKAYTDSLTARAMVADKANHTLLDTGGWGDWCAPTGNSSRGGCGGHGTCGGSYEYISSLRIMVAWARVTGNAADEAHYTAEEAKVSAAFAIAYYEDEEGGGFSCASTTAQTANALGLMVAPRAAGALASLVSEVEQKGHHLDTGIVGTKYLFESLSFGGRADVALAVLLQQTYPGYGYWLSQGATSLWENWEGDRYTHLGSWNHVMFGSASEFIFRHVVGIQQPAGSRGFTAIEFHPSVLLASSTSAAASTAPAVDACAELGGVNASMARPHGEIKAAWTCKGPQSEGGGITYSVTLPVGVPSRVHLPLLSKPTQVTESGAVIFDGSKFVAGAAQGVVAAALATDGLSVVVETQSGSYSFTTSSAK